MLNESFHRNLPKLYARFALIDDHLRVGKLIDMHYHDEIEILLVTEGEIYCHVDGGTLSAREGQILFVDARVPHWTEASAGGCRYILLQFVPEYFDTGSNRERNSLHYLYSFVRKSHPSSGLIDDAGCENAIRFAWSTYSHNHDGADKFVLSCIYYLLGYLEQSGCLPKEVLPDEKAARKLLPALEYIENHYRQQDLSLEAISQVLNLTPVYFSRLFKRSTGHCFTEYLNYVRVSKSETLLQGTTMSILEISMEVGFSSVSYYNRIFKRMKNCTPSLYRSAQYSSP